MVDKCDVIDQDNFASTFKIIRYKLRIELVSSGNKPRSSAKATYALSSMSLTFVSNLWNYITLKRKVWLANIAIISLALDQSQHFYGLTCFCRHKHLLQMYLFTE